MRTLRVMATAFLAVLISSPLAAQATGSVKGRVLEKGSAQPIPGAMVVILVGGARLGGLTDNAGAYVIRAVPVGQVAVRALRIG